MISVLSPFQYGAVFSKVHARISQLLTHNEWDELLEATDFKSFLQQLGNTSYEKLVKSFQKGLGEGAPAVALFERNLRRHLVERTWDLIDYILGGPKDLLYWWLKRDEIENLKNILRGISQPAEKEETRNLLIPLEDYSSIDWEGLLNADGINELMVQLSGTWYVKILEPALDRYQESENPLIMEVRLDLAYYHRLLELIRSVKGKDRQEAELFIGTYIDSQNVLWAFRFRDYYQLSAEEILNYTLHEGIKVDVSTIKKIARGGKLEEILRDIWGEHLPGLDQLAKTPDKQAISNALVIFRKYLLDKAQTVRDDYAMHLGIFLGYKVILENEIQNLISAVEGKSMGLSEDRIREYLVFEEEDTSQ